MGTVTKIQWCDHTFNPWIGCAKVHAGCTNCYAEADMDKRRGRVKWGPNGTRSMTSDANWRNPMKWNREAEAAGVRRRVFCASLADVFEDWQGPIVDHKGAPLHHADKWYRGNRGQFIPVSGVWIGKSLVKMNDLRSRLFALIDATPHLDWLLLTKRPENIARMWPCPLDTDNDGNCHQCSRGRVHYRPNVWLGTSVSDQATADKMVPDLLKCRDLSPVLFVSAEPLLGPMDLRNVQLPELPKDAYLRPINECRRVDSLRGKVYGPLMFGELVFPGPRVDWVIIGGESGPDDRPCRVEWVRSLVKQCQEADVPPFVKQLGRFPITRLPNGEQWPGGCGLPCDGPLRFDSDGFGNFTVRGLQDPKGGDPDEWPEDLQVREVPRAADIQ